MTVAELLFQLPSTDAWETRLQVTYLAPVAPSDPNLPVDAEARPLPRANIVVSRVPTIETDPVVEYRKFISQTAKTVPNLEVVDDVAPFGFDDDKQGAIAEISFRATPLVRLTQLHAFRIDNGVLTQLVATLDEFEGTQKRDELRRMLLSFAPRSTPARLSG